MTTQVRKPAPSATVPVAPPHRRRWLAMLVIALLLATGLGVRAWQQHRASDVRNGTTAVSADGMAARYGIDVNLVAVTAAGGLIELRYQVVDPDKAAPLIHDPEAAPTLVVEESGETLRMASPPHRHGGELKLGGTYFFLMANAHNALSEGDLVTLVIGDVRLEHIETQG
ncbi:MAG: hypothetical protein U0R80_06010 [Nocardioidaceae bacterium]